MIDPIFCANTPCTNRVLKTGDYCATCIEQGKHLTADEKAKLALKYLETKQTGRRVKKSDNRWKK